MLMNTDWSVRECSEPWELEALFRFRYAEYVEKKGLFEDVADHKNRFLKDTIDTFATNFAAFNRNNEVIGSIRFNGFDRFVQNFCITEFRILDVSPLTMERGGVVTRAMVREDWRSKPVFSELVLAAARSMNEKRIRWVFIDTAASRAADDEQRFLSLYASMGFKVWRDDVLVPGAGFGAAMLLDMEAAKENRKSLARMYLCSEAPPKNSLEKARRPLFPGALASGREHETGTRAGSRDF